MDLKEYFKLTKLVLVKVVNGKIYKLKVNFLFIIEQKHTIYEWVSNLRMLDDYIAKLDKHVDVSEGKLHDMKSHDCHIYGMLTFNCIY